MVIILTHNCRLQDWKQFSYQNPQAHPSFFISHFPSPHFPAASQFSPCLLNTTQPQGDQQDIDKPFCITLILFRDSSVLCFFQSFSDSRICISVLFKDQGLFAQKQVQKSLFLQPLICPQCQGRRHLCHHYHGPTVSPMYNYRETVASFTKYNFQPQVTFHLGLVLKCITKT